MFIRPLSSLLHHTEVEKRRIHKCKRISNRDKVYQRYLQSERNFAQSYDQVGIIHSDEVTSHIVASLNEKNV